MLLLLTLRSLKGLIEGAPEWTEYTCNMFAFKKFRM